MGLALDYALAPVRQAAQDVRQNARDAAERARPIAQADVVEAVDRPVLEDAETIATHSVGRPASELVERPVPDALVTVAKIAEEDALVDAAIHVDLIALETRANRTALHHVPIVAPVYAEEADAELFVLVIAVVAAQLVVGVVAADHVGVVELAALVTVVVVPELVNQNQNQTPLEGDAQHATVVAGLRVTDAADATGHAMVAARMRVILHAGCVILIATAFVKLLAAEIARTGALHVSAARPAAILHAVPIAQMDASLVALTSVMHVPDALDFVTAVLENATVVLQVAEDHVRWDVDQRALGAMEVAQRFVRLRVLHPAYLNAQPLAQVLVQEHYSGQLKPINYSQ